MNSVLFRTLGVLGYAALFYFLMNMGRKKEKCTIPYLLVCISLVIIVFTVRIYPLIEIYDEKIFTILKAVFSSIVGISLANFIKAVFRNKKIDTTVRFLIICSLLANSLFLPIFLFFEMHWALNALYGILLLSGCILVASTIYNAVKYKLYKDRQQFFVLIGLSIYIFQAITYMIYEGILDKPVLPLYAQPGIITISIFYIIIFISNLRWEHKNLLFMNTLLEEKIREKTLALEQAHINKSMIFAHLAHEIKTPLTLIKNNLKRFIEIHGNSSETNEIMKYTEDMIQDIINILNMEKTDQQELFLLESESLNLSNFVKNKIKMFQYAAKAKLITIKSKIEKEIFVKSDPIAMDMILNNLLDNAIKYNTENGSISVNMTSYDSGIVLVVSDTGIGIDQDKLEHIFEPFYRISKEKMYKEGIGIGLSLTKKIVTTLGGTVSAQNNPDTGSSFIIQLPKSENPNSEIIDSGLPTHQTPNSYQNHHIITDLFIDKRRSNILVVEDNSQMLAFMRETISTKYNFYFARNGCEAIDKLKRIPYPDLIISDVFMEEMDGKELFSQLSQNDEYSSIPFIFLTALHSDNDVVSALNEGAVDYIQKPFSSELLLAKMHSLISNRRNYANKLIKDINKKLIDVISGQNNLVSIESPENDRQVFYNILEEKYNMSPRELEICDLLEQGYLYKEIAVKLDISSHTVETYRKRIFKKCRVQNKSELLSLLK